MAKASTRFRNRKINFKTRISIKRGNEAFDIEEDFEGEGVEFEEEGRDGQHKDRNHVETGVDKEEEHELHLQAVIASATASVSRSGAAAGGSSSRASTSKPVPKAYIPTPDSTGTIDESLFAELYPAGVWTDPTTYVRFSDTVEDAQIGAVMYTMDEDDEDWLESYNASCGVEGKPLDAVPNGAATGRGARERKPKGAPKDDKGKEVSMGPLGEDEFELVMEVFETVTEEKAPMAHVDVSLLPSLSDMETAFSDPKRPTNVAALKGFAKTVYQHWKDRRLKRQGKSIIPQLDYDESNENNPYVCFRRRELKTSRKTRRSDAQNVERLVRLRNDLFAAHALMIKTRDRERLKLESIEMERKIFESRCEMRELKRRLGEAEGDEDILIGRREKRKRKEEVAAQGTGMRISFRKPDSMATPSSLITSAEELKVRKDRAAAVMQRMEKDIAKKRESDQLWEEWTDSAFMTRPPPLPARYWRTVEAVPGSLPFKTPDGKVEALAFVQALQPAIGHVRTSFRRRVGRGGRIMLDRIAPGIGRKARSQPTVPLDDSDASDVESEEDQDAFLRRQERLRYDTDANIDFPAADEPTVIDDFEFRFLVKRSGLLRTNDFDFLTPDNSYIEQAYAYAGEEPEKPTVPPTVFGRPPPRPAIPVQPGGPGGVPMPQAGQAQTYQQMQLQAHRVAQQAAAVQQQKRLSTGGPNGTPIPDAMRKSGSAGGSPVSQGQQLPIPMQMPVQLPMSLPVNGSPIQGQWINGQGMATKPDGSVVLPPGFPNHLQQQLPNGLHLPPQRLPNGLVAALPNGANGLPATSRLSAPPFSNSSPMQLPMPLPSQSPHPMSSPIPHGVVTHLQRPGSANSQQHPPSRPSSAQSSHHNSPQIVSQVLPNAGPLLSPNMHANGKRPSPQIVHPTIQAAGHQAQLKQAGLHQQLTY